jgi:hypothetical protein
VKNALQQLSPERVLEGRGPNPNDLAAMLKWVLLALA